MPVLACGHADSVSGGFISLFSLGFRWLQALYKGWKLALPSALLQRLTPVGVFSCLGDHVPQLIGFAANGGSDFSQKKQKPCFADNHGEDLTAEGIKEGVSKVFTLLDKQGGAAWVGLFKDSRHYVRKA